MRHRKLILTTMGLTILSAGSALSAKDQDSDPCGNGIKTQNLAKMSPKKLLKAVRGTDLGKRPKQDTSRVSTARLTEWKQGLGWFGIGDTHPGTFEYYVGYDPSAEPGAQYHVFVRDHYGFPIARDVVVRQGERRFVLSYVESYTEIDAMHGQATARQIAPQRLDSYRVAKYALSTADFEAIAALGGTGVVTSDEEVAPYGSKSCKLTLFPAEFRILKQVVEGPSTWDD